MPDANPPPNPAHQVGIVATAGPWGGLTRTYRGARIEANDKETLFGLLLEGHPMHGAAMGSWENMLPLIDAWAEGRDAPPPYRWTRP